MARGRKDKYESHIKPFLESIDLWLNEGATEKNVAAKLGIAYPTWNKYKSDHKELKDLCEKPRSKLIDDLRGALVKKSLGFTRTVKRAMKVKDIEYEDGKRLRQTEKVIFFDEEIYFPPDTTAIFGALNIYDPNYVKDRATHELRKEELELAKEKAKNEDW